MEEYNRIQQQLDDLLGETAEARHARQRRLLEAIEQMHRGLLDEKVKALGLGTDTAEQQPFGQEDYLRVGNRKERREQARRERRAAKKVKA